MVRIHPLPPGREGARLIRMEVIFYTDFFFLAVQSLDIFFNAITGREGARLTRLLLFGKGRVFCLAVQSLDILFVIKTNSEKRTRSNSLRRVRRPRCPELSKIQSVRKKLLYKTKSIYSPQTA